MNPVVANNWSVLNSKVRILSNGFRQSKPYNLDLPHQKRVLKVTSVSAYGSADLSGADIGEGGGYSQPSVAADIVSDSDAILAGNMARSRFRSSIGEQSGWLLNLAQRRQTMTMLSETVLRIAQSAQYLRRGNWVGAARRLGLTDRDIRRIRKRGIRGGAKHFANDFLALHFGWEPLIKDVYSSMKLLSSDPPNTLIVSSGRSERLERDDVGGVSWRRSVKVTSCRCKVRARVAVSNPDLYLMNSLGIINPMYVAWDAVPFSFVVDWFVNVGEYLNAFQGLDLAGLTITRPITTYRLASELDYSYGNTGAKWAVYTHKSGFGFKRVLSIPSVRLRAPKVERLSVTRAAVAISLLLQTLKS